MKALHIKNKKTRGHNLLELFQDLPHELKCNIIGSKDRKAFIEELTRISCLFEEWRYSYEYQIKSFKFPFLIDFAESLSSVTDKKC